MNLSTKLRLATDEIRTDLELWLLKPRPAIGEIWSPALRIQQIVVNPALRRWETMHTLALVYRDVYFTQVVDRYQAKWKGYVQLASNARESFVAGGLPVVSDPLPRALPPVLVSTTGSQTGGTFYASVAWVNGAGQQGAASEASSMTVADGNVMIIAAVSAPPNAAGVVMFAGTSLVGMVLQTPAALPAASTYTYLPGGVTDGPSPGCGQTPEFTRPVARTLLRG